jgi:hypothetical protein
MGTGLLLLAKGWAFIAESKVISLGVGQASRLFLTC